MAARKLNYLIFITIAGCCFSIIILGISLGTNKWYQAVIVRAANGATVKATCNYGLLGGSKYSVTRTMVGDVAVEQTGDTKDLKLVSKIGDNVAMYSCGSDGTKRKNDLEAWLDPKFANDLDTDQHDRVYCDGIAKNETAVGGLKAVSKDRFLNFGLWLTTLIFLLGGMIFSGVSGGLALYNTFRAPINPLFSVFGLYIWNGIAAGSTLMAIILWGSAFGSILKNDAAVSESIGGLYQRESSSLGYSYWIAILAECICWLNIGILRYRTWAIHRRETNLRVVDDKFTSPDHLMF